MDSRAQVRALWAGPYDGEEPGRVACFWVDRQSSVIGVVCRERFDEAGRSVVLPLGAHEIYAYCVGHQRWEWKGTRETIEA